jgi:hypothetical protein
VKNTRDIVSEALIEIADIWKVDPARSIPTDDGFDWWPGDFKVSVSTTRRTDGYVPETWMLSVKTDFLKEIPIDSDRFLRLQARFHRPMHGFFLRRRSGITTASREQGRNFDLPIPPT